MPTVYSITYKKSVDKDLRKLPAGIRKQIITKIQDLAADPTPTMSTKLKGVQNLYRLRHRDYRIVYEIREAKLVILVIKIGHRKEVYKQI